MFPRPLRCLCLLGVLIVGTGCTRAYWVDRGRDALDVGTITVGLGGGAYARVGPVATGLGLFANQYGLQSGELFTKGGELENGFDLPLVIHALAMNPESSARRGKDYLSEHLMGIAIPAANGIVPKEPSKYSVSFFTDIEVAAGLLLTIKAGINPGELLDLILGFTTLDIYGDDVEKAP